MNLNADSTIRRSRDPITAEVDGEVVMMSVERGNYYGLDEIGTRIWDLLEQPLQVASLCDALVREFAVDRPTCERDVLAFLERMAEQGLIELVEPA